MDFTTALKDDGSKVSELIMETNSIKRESFFEYINCYIQGDKLLIRKKDLKIFFTEAKNNKWNTNIGNNSTTKTFKTYLKDLISVIQSNKDKFLPLIEENEDALIFQYDNGFDNASNDVLFDYNKEFITQYKDFISSISEFKNLNIQDINYGVFYNNETKEFKIVDICSLWYTPLNEIRNLEIIANDKNNTIYILSDKITKDNKKYIQSLNYLIDTTERMTYKHI